ncbi:MAG: SAM-dependent methyltransferase [Nanoarchaeota archaeon]
MKFVIEHLEPELYDWCIIEYEHISKIVGKGNLIFTNIKNKKETEKLKKYGSVYDKSISELKLNKFKPKNICILSQYSEITLKTSDKNKFEHLVFGGILGDNPAKRRTIELTKKLEKEGLSFETRNLGKGQMPTDTAVYVAKKILDGKKLEDMKFVDELEIEINENESVNLNFRFVVDDGKLVINEKLVEHLREKDGF